MRNYTVCPEWIYDTTSPIDIWNQTKWVHNKRSYRALFHARNKKKHDSKHKFLHITKIFLLIFCHTFLINITTRGLCSLHFTKKKGKQKGMRLRNHNIIAYLIHPTLVPLPHHTSNFSTSSHHTHAPPSPPPTSTLILKE